MFTLASLLRRVVACRACCVASSLAVGKELAIRKRRRAARAHAARRASVFFVFLFCLGGRDFDASARGAWRVAASRRRMYPCECTGRQPAAWRRCAGHVSLELGGARGVFCGFFFASRRASQPVARCALRRRSAARALVGDSAGRARRPALASALARRRAPRRRGAAPFDGSRGDEAILNACGARACLMRAARLRGPTLARFDLTPVVCVRRNRRRLPLLSRSL